MPTLTVARGESKKKRAGSNIDFSAIWEIVGSNHIQYEDNGVYSYIGIGDGTQENIGQLRTRQPLDPHTGLSSIEITIVDTGETNFIGIGVCNKAYPMDHLPGWKETSIAIHTDDGSIFNSHSDPEPLGPSCGRGCVIRCVLIPDPQDNAGTVIEFFRDGERVKAVSTHTPEGGFYGIVGMMSRGERIQISPPVVTQRVDFNKVWEVCTPHTIQHQRDGLCSYVGPGYSNEESIGTVRTKQKIDPFGTCSFEIRIINPGEKMYIAIGICSQDYPPNMLPGWKETSVGYHADNGSLFYNSDSGQPTDHPCQKGDIMRCTVQPVDGSQKQVLLIFHRNNQIVGKLTAWTPENGFYGCFGMMSKQECVQVALPEISEPYTIPKVNFLSVWEPSTSHLQYQENGVFAYTGEGGPDSVGTVRSRAPVDPLSPNNTFEVKILDPGDRCYIALGVCNPRYPTTQLPGWSEISVGFHADNGLILNGVGEEQIETRCNCIKGDVIRCTVEPVDGSNKQIHVIFHRNMVFIGKVLLWNPSKGLYAQVGSMSKGEVIQIASPQTDPSSLMHDALHHSASVPAVQNPKLAMKQKQLSADNLSHITPSQAPYDPHHSRGVATEVHTSARSFARPPEVASHYPEHQTRHPDDFHQHHKHHSSSPQATPSPRHVERHFPLPPLVPFEHAETASPLPLQPTDGHPLGQQRAKPAVRLHPHITKQNPYYASQASNASAASDSDPHYWSQISTESQREGRLRAASGFYVHGTLPNELSREYRTQAQPIPPNPTPKPSFSIQPEDTSVKPLVPNFEPNNIKTSPTGVKTSISDNVVKKGFDYPDSPITPKSGSSKALQHFPPVQTKRESVHEPVKQLELASQPPSSHLFTKRENSLCRILYNVSCSENGTLRCTLPVGSTKSSFVMRQLQLTEKMPYFEVELEEYNSTQTVIIGLVPQDHPYTVPIGSLPHTIAYHTDTGSLVTGGQESESITKACTAGDVVGCKVEWTYKLEACDPKQESLVKVEWFHNGCSVAIKSIRVPASGFYPAIGMTSTGTTVKVRHSIGLKPDSFFDSHPLPDNFTNLEVPLYTTEGWNCFQNAQIDEKNYIMFQEEHSSLPTIVQSQTPFTTVNPYLEVELQYPISSYSILSVGALGRISNPKQVIPGEAPNSIGLFPLLGFVMRNGSISTTLPQTVEAEMKNSSEKLRVGVGVDFNTKIPYSSTTRRVKIFFTINSQLINSTYATIPPTGLCPTLAVGSDFRKMGDRLVLLQFSHPRPQVSTLPLGFARAPPDSFRKMTLRTVAAENILPEGRDTPQALQAALPFSLSHTYFELKIARCLESHVFSCGVTPHNSSLTCHPGTFQDSIGFYPSEGSIHQNGQSSIVCPPCSYKGAKIGCGARFPSDGSSKYMEVFFTVNERMIARRLMSIPEPGLFPTVGFYTKGRGVVTVNVYAEDPFPDLQFNTTWRELRSMKAEGATLQTTSLSQPCVAQLVQAVALDKPAYFTITPLTDIARVLIGFSNHITCPLLEDHPSLLPKAGDDGCDTKEITVPWQEGWRGCVVDAVTGEALVQDRLCSVEPCRIEQSRQYGCGIEPIKNTSYHLFFFTTNNQVVFCRRFRVTGDTMFPTIFVSGSSARISVDACALWPLQTAIGKGWARMKHLVLENSIIRHIAIDQRAKIPVGFAQASMPVIPSLSYFEVEVCSRSVDKAIAVGLASKMYPNNTWVGWKPNSIAYYLDDGNLFTGSGMFSHKIGPKIFQGHIVGCGVVAKPSDSETKEGKKVEVFFTVNGAVIVEQKIAVPSGGFYPTVCLESPTESIIFHRYPRFPPVQNLVGNDWGNCYSVHRAGMVLEHSCKHKELPPKGIPRGFCQASRPFSPERPYFEINIVGFTDASLIQAGAAVEMPLGCRTASTDSLMYSCVGHIQVRSGGQKSTTGTQRCGIGDTIGCALNFTDDKPTSIEFYLNKMKLLKQPLLEKWKGRPLFPTIVLSQPGNAVLPEMNLPPPQWDRSSLIGWLRTERVRVRGNMAEYRPSDDEKYEVGLCQISQCLENDLNSSFEVEILDRGMKCTIGVGAASTDYCAKCQPGWKENSIAYHGDDGGLFNNSPYGISFGPTWKERDVIGVGVRQPDFESTEECETQVYFTKNGLEIGHATITIPPTGLFPTVGFHSPGEKVKITFNPSSNLGNFDPAILRWREMCGIQLQSTSQENQCVLQYYDNGRKMPQSGTKLAVAVYGKPFSEKLQYFELDLMSMGTHTTIAIGVVPKGYPLDYAPGWGKDSLGYHTDYGQLFQACDQGKYFGPIAKKGDVIGCGINFISNNQRQCSVYFTYNGVEIGRVRASIPASGLYPSLCLMQKHDRVRVTVLETFKPKVSIPELHMVGLMRISNCSYSDQIVQFTGGHVSTPGIAQFAVPMHKDRNYFATHILKADDAIIIGLAVRDYPLKYPPGSTSISMAYNITKGSIRAVYDSDNFHKFDAAELKCMVGDRVGCGVVPSDSKSEPGFVYFTRNGSVVKKIQFAEIFEDLYPVVGFVPDQRSSLLFMDWNMPLFDSPNLLCDC